MAEPVARRQWPPRRWGYRAHAFHQLFKHAFGHAKRAAVHANIFANKNTLGSRRISCCRASRMASEYLISRNCGQCSWGIYLCFQVFGEGSGTGGLFRSVLNGFERFLVNGCHIIGGDQFGFHQGFRQNV
jgi:hypothetical protein